MSGRLALYPAAVRFWARKKSEGYGMKGGKPVSFHRLSWMNPSE